MKYGTIFPLFNANLWRLSKICPEKPSILRILYLTLLQPKVRAQAYGGWVTLPRKPSEKIIFMVDTHLPSQRHANMAAIHGKDTKPEMVVRQWLWRNGFRYRLNYPRLPGKPDIVMRKYRTCIFVNGCFWHGHHVAMPEVVDSECCKIPKTNRDFWVAKIRRNQERDTRVQHELAAMGWHCITIWECELKPKVRKKTLESLAYTLNRIFLQDRFVRRYEMPEEVPLLAAEDIPEYCRRDKEGKGHKSKT